MVSKPLLRWGGDGRPLREETAEPEAHSTSTEAHSTSTAHHAVRKPHTVDQPKDGAGRMSGTSGKPTKEPSTTRVPRSKPQRQVAAAETGRPETSQEYACRVRDHFVLLGPGQRKEGGETGDTHPNPPEPLETAGQLTERPLTPPQMPVYPEEELLGEIKDQYHRDPFFKKVLDAPKEFRNFVLKDGIIRVKLHDRTTICIPDIKVGDR